MNKIDTGIAELLAKQPSDSAEKDAYIAELQKTVRLLTDEVRNMDELLALLRKKQFAPSSEQTKPTEEQLGLFNEAEQENKPEPKEPIKRMPVATIPMAMPDITRSLMSHAAAVGRICEESSWRLCRRKVMRLYLHRSGGTFVTSSLQLKKKYRGFRLNSGRKSALRSNNRCLGLFGVGWMSSAHSHWPVA